jgi:D-alanyl-D-alanine dipeptidase
VRQLVPVPAGELAERTARVQQAMGAQGIEYLVVGPSSDLVYLIDLDTRQSERLTVLVVPRDGTSTLVMPGFETPRVAGLAATFDTATWDDGEDPFAVLASVLRKPRTVAISPQLFSHFLFRIRDVLDGSDCRNGASILEPVRMRKSPWELEQVASASSAADAAFEALVETSLEGATEREVQERISNLLIEKGHESVSGVIVGVRGNGASPHHRAGDTRLEAGSPIVVDFGGSFNKYRSDITRTFHIGEPTQEFHEVYEIVDQANRKAFELAKPGVRAADVDAEVRAYIAAAGYPDAFVHRLGHGIGLEYHEPPYLVAGSDDVLEEGMTFSIEPGIYLEGCFGVRIEDIAVVTSDGARRLNLSTHELLVV